MRIKETEKYWHVDFFPDAEDHQLEDHVAEKGWRWMTGIYQDQFVPKYIEYSKSRFSLDDAINYAKRISTCSVCEKLNRDVAKIESIDIKTANNHIEHSMTEMERKGKISDRFKDMLMNIFFDSFFTKPGMFFVGAMLDDDSLIERALPRNINDDEIANFTAELAHFLAGDISLVRSPEDMTEYAHAIAMRAEKRRGDEENNGKEKNKKNADIWDKAMKKIAAETAEVLI